MELDGRTVTDDSPIFHVDIELDDAKGKTKTYRMPVNFAAMRRVCEAECSPQQIYRAATTGGGLDLSDLQSVRILHIGVTEGGAQLTEEQVYDAVQRRTLVAYALALGMYLGAFVHGGIRRDFKASDLAADGSKKKRRVGKRKRGGSSKTRTKSRSGRGGSGRGSSG